ncbi:amino acid permease-associated region [Thermaerobacter marianensis DSM 12885]|uniref:Amino acid permease-associated region n=1 Tax=Thermaerobacter marianensis (strain ATCC 700841 / DSM 12885 / JCM 10246 / 7p75a) TaxID=644966 RepID=E6SKT6_THEM7|nr:amino acid permease [Thermaerobacter marianensis]ADU52309.1 amino acid permease-associated region [Thermaerobacter marianensis DSM 12885]
MPRRDGLTAGQLTVLALGSAIGGAFFLGSAVAIRSAGPAVLLGFAAGGAIVYVVLMALADLTLEDPAPGSFRHYAQRAFGPLAGFVVGWVYWAGLTLAMSSEATAAAVFLRTWWPGAAGPVLATLIVLAVTGLNLLGARQLAGLEGLLAGVKLLAVAGFVLVALSLIAGLWPGRAPVGWGALAGEPWGAAGWRGLLGAMLIVMFSYAGTEVIGLAAPSARDPRGTVLRAARRTALLLAGLYVLAVGSLLPLIPTARLDVTASPMVTALAVHGLGAAARMVNAVLVTAILSTMLAVMFSLGRVVRSLAEDGMGPAWLVDRGPVPRRGIVFSGAVMLAGVALGYLVPRQVYVFLVSAGGFALLLVYASIVAAHWRLRRQAEAGGRRGVPLVPGFPWSSALVLAVLLAIMAGMPLVPGQESGLLAGLAMAAVAAGVYGWRARAGLTRQTPAPAGAPGETGTGAPGRETARPPRPVTGRPQPAPAPPVTSGAEVAGRPWAGPPGRAPQRRTVPRPAVAFETAEEMTPVHDTGEGGPEEARKEGRRERPPR